MLKLPDHEPSAMSQTFSCPVCTGNAPALDVVDFNKNCLEPQGHFLPLARLPVYYHMCDNCDHVFSPDFWEWEDRDFAQKIYNDDYFSLDPDYLETRPVGNAKLLLQLFGAHSSSIAHLDYGGGNGQLSRYLQQHGWNSTSFDPFPQTPFEPNHLGRFNLITAFEVFEHVPHPQQLLTNITQLMSESCLVLFSTLTSDNSLKRNARIDWWYCSPRNGHINLFTRKSLSLLGAQHQLKFGSINEGLHCYANQIPTWATQFSG